MPPRAARTEVIRARVTPVTKTEIFTLATTLDRTESDVVRMLVEEALTERARRRR